jgi:hypothetical protein
MHTLSLREMAAALDNPITTVARPYQPSITPEATTPPKVGAEWRTILDDLYAGLESPADERTVKSAIEAASHVGDLVAKVDVLQSIATRNRAEVGEIRDLYKTKDLIRTADAAKEKLHSIKVQEKFLVTDALGRNMQSLVSYHNAKKDGKRFKTKRIDSSTPVFQVWRTR